MNPSVLNSLCYSAGWFWCVLLGVQGHSLFAAVGAVCLIVLQLLYTKAKNIGLYIQDFLLVLFSSILGTLLEMFFMATHLIRYGNHEWLPPIWIVFLYPLFSLLLNHSLRIIKTHDLTSFLFGLLGAPLSYFAGYSLGGLTFPLPLIPSLVAIGICWGLFLCMLAKLANIIEKAAKETLEDRNSTSGVKLLYDGECPLCKREISFLKSKDDRCKIDFVDISTKDYSPDANNNIDYETAMSQIHAIDGKGGLLVGIPAFASVYARSQLLVTSTLLRLPFMKPLFKVFYTLFAKYRLLITERKK